MSKPLFTAKATKDFDDKIKEISANRSRFSSWDEQNAAAQKVRTARFAQAVTRIRNDRMDDFINYLLLMVGTKGERADIDVWNGFSLADNSEYAKKVSEQDTPIIRRQLHMFLKAVLVAPRNFAVTAFVKFLRGNSVAGGKANGLEGFGDFHKDSGWSEFHVKAVAEILFDGLSEVTKLFMQYDHSIGDRVYEASQEDDDVPYQAQFAATRRTVNTEFLNEVINAVEKRGLAPKPQSTKKPFKPHEKHEFKPGDTIRKDTIQDLPAMSLIEIQARACKERGGVPIDLTVQIVLVKKPVPRQRLIIWRIRKDKAYMPNGIYAFDQDRSCLEGAVYKGKWEAGVQAHQDEVGYGYQRIAIPKNF